MCLGGQKKDWEEDSEESLLRHRVCGVLLGSSFLIGVHILLGYLQHWGGGGRRIRSLLTSLTTPQSSSGSSHSFIAFIYFLL